MFPSHKTMKDGQPVYKDGKPQYTSDVYITNVDDRARVEEAVLNAMYNKGVTVTPGTNNSPNTSNSFTPPSQPSKNVQVTTSTPQQSNNTPLSYDDDLPF